MDKFTRLIYTSKAVEGITEEQLTQIANVAAKGNAKLGVSGVLLYSGGRFLQLIEGEGSIIDELYLGRIVQDGRHVDHRLLLREQCDHRLFPNWSMGRLCLTRTDGSAHAAWDALCAEVHRQSPQVVLKEDAALQLISEFIDRFGDECDRMMREAWINSIKTPAMPAA